MTVCLKKKELFIMNFIPGTFFSFNYVICTVVVTTIPLSPPLLLTDTTLNTAYKSNSPIVEEFH